MPEVWLFVVLGIIALLGFTVAGVAGFGAGVILLPVLVWVFGPKEAVPILSVATFLAAVSRTGLNWRDISWSVVKWNSLGAVPVSVLATLLFVVTPPTILVRLLGALLLLLVVYRHTNFGRDRSFGLRKFVLVGAGTSLVGGFLGVPGPIKAPFLLAYGLTGVAFVGTSAVTTVLTQLSKMAVFRTTDLLGMQVLLIGVALGVFGFSGAYLGRWVSKRAPKRAFLLIVEGLMMIGGILLLITG